MVPRRNMQNILVAGCSFTEQCGFTKQNQPLYHWPYLLADYYESDVTNIGINAGTCEEIFYRTLEQVIDTSYDYAVVVWSYPHRRWMYSSHNNVDDYTILGPPAEGKNADINGVKDYARLHYKHFDNSYMNLKRFLLQVKSLELALKNLNRKYVFVQGTNTLCREVFDCNLTSDIKDMLDFENRPDEYISEKLNDLRNILTSIDFDNTIEWLDYSFYDNRLDRADDNVHPGPRSNKLLFDKLVAHIANK